MFTQLPPPPTPQMSRSDILPPSPIYACCIKGRNSEAPSNQHKGKPDAWIWEPARACTPTPIPVGVWQDLAAHLPAQAGLTLPRPQLFVQARVQTLKPPVPIHGE